MGTRCEKCVNITMDDVHVSFSLSVMRTSIYYTYFDSVEPLDVERHKAFLCYCLLFLLSPSNLALHLLGFFVSFLTERWERRRERERESEGGRGGIMTNNACEQAGT